MSSESITPANSALNSLFGSSLGEVGSLFGGYPDSSASTSKPPQSSQEDDLHVGCTVQLHGLKGAVELNGKTGILDSLIEASGRWRVKLACGDSKDLKPENLKRDKEQLPIAYTNQSQEDSMPAPVIGAPSGGHEEGALMERAGGPKVVVISTFDDLADFEDIAATQGLTEEDLEGQMTILDASGKSFTWETFSPAAKFPIKMQFASEADTQQSTDAADDGRTAAAKKSAKNAKKRASAKLRRERLGT